MKESMYFLFFVSLFGLFSFQEANNNLVTSEQGPSWIKIGSKSVSKGKDNDVIYVTNSRRGFRKLKLKIAKSPVHITNMRVFFRNGNEQNFEINKDFHKNSSSIVFDLQGRKKKIEKIVFNYHTKRMAQGKARIHVLGK